MRIAKKARSVKRQKRAEPLPPPRYTIRKDALDRRYAIDKRNGRRVPLAKAEKERVKRRQVAKPIPRHTPPKAKKPSKTRSIAAKKAWVVRKERSQARSLAAKRGWEKRKKLPPVELVTVESLAPVELPSLIPEGITLVPLGDMRAKARHSPKVRKNLDYAFARIQRDTWEKIERKLRGKPSPKLTQEDRIKGNIRDLMAERLRDADDIERVVQELYESFGRDYSVRELYEIYFSPEVA